MLEIISSTSSSTWDWLSAERAVLYALATLDDAADALLPLIDASQWQAEGVRALNAFIVDLQARTASEVVELTNRLWEIKGAML